MEIIWPDNNYVEGLGWDLSLIPEPELVSEYDAFGEVITEE